MLKRGDLAKQFELIVQQEIKNHNDQIYASNQAIKGNSEKIQELIEIENRNLAHLKSELNKLQMFLVEQKKDFDTLSAKFSSFYNDQNDKNEKNAIERKELVETFFSFKLTLTSALAKCEQEESKNKHELSLMKNLASVNEISLDNWYVRIKKELEKFKAELLGRPSEIPELKKDFDDKFHCHKLDVEGVMKEFHILKKENFVVEKKLENIYTLIDRLKKGIVDGT